MAKKTNTTVVNKARVDEIARALYDATAVITTHELAVHDAKTILDGAREADQGERLTVMARAAHLSIQGAWTVDEIKSAAKIAAAMGASENSKSRGTFASQIKVAAMPAVRQHFNDITTVVNDIWARETEDAKLGNPVPLRVATSRKFHAVCQVCVALQDGELVRVDDAAITQWARGKDPALDADKVRKRLENIIASIDEMFMDFPHDDLKTAAEYLGTVDAKALQAARDARLAAQADAVEQARITTATPEQGRQQATTAAPEPAPEPAPKPAKRGLAPRRVAVAPGGNAATGVTRTAAQIAEAALAAGITDNDIDDLISGENIITAQLAA